MGDRIIDAATLKRFPEREGALDANGRPQVKPAEFWNQFSENERFAFCVRHAVYCIPTTELVQWLRDKITERGPDELDRTLEIGSGNGVLAAALRIMATDSLLQRRSDIVEHFRRMQQPTIAYGPEVRRYDAETAVRLFKPTTVLGAWVTHRWREERGGSGSPYGVDEAKIIASGARYIFIGNDGGSTQHGERPILEREHARYCFPWLVSRGERGHDFIAIWGES